MGELNLMRSTSEDPNEERREEQNRNDGETIEVVTENSIERGPSTQQSQSATTTSSPSVRDSRDEEDEEDQSISSLGYSDDSASLSDAYFRPQPGDDLGRAGMSRKELHPYNPYQTHHYYLYAGSSSTYGSLQVSNGSDKVGSPLWLGTPIQEDVETMLPIPHYGIRHDEHYSLLAPNAFKKDRKRSKKRRQELHRIQIKQREQAAREQAVHEVRGQPQEPTVWRDWIWSVLFMAQLFVVFLCALRFGSDVILFKDTSVWQEDFQRFEAFEWDRRRTLQLSSGGTDLNATSLMDILFTDDVALLHGDDFVAAASTANAVSFTIDYQNVLAVIFFSGSYACILSYISFGFMIMVARSLVFIMLVFSVLASLVWGTLGMTLDPYGVISITGFAALLSTLGYTIYTWNQIPFAATNLSTALAGLRCTADITILGLVGLAASFGWCLVWSMAFVGIVNTFNSSDCDQNDACHPHVNRIHFPIYIALLISFQWTIMVIKNLVRTVVAGAISTWWFQPHDVGPFCTAAVITPLVRSLTTSFGSVCLGSLLTSPVQWMICGLQFCLCIPDPNAKDPSSCMKGTGTKEVPEGAGENGVVYDTKATADSPADSVQFCHQFCNVWGTWIQCLRSCNRWCFSYIGMYGYGYFESGERALQLFETRGWMEVVEDSLIQNVLTMACVVIGGSTGLFSVVVEETDGYDFSSLHQPILTAFLIGLIVGYVLSNVLLLGVVESAVNTVLICFAAGPFDFDKNHPRLSSEMREVWSQQVWEPAT